LASVDKGFSKVCEETQSDKGTPQTCPDDMVGTPRNCQCTSGSKGACKYIPGLGYLDDLIIVPLGILAVVKLIPPGIMAEHRATAALAAESRQAASPLR